LAASLVNSVATDHLLLLFGQVVERDGFTMPTGGKKHGHLPRAMRVSLTLEDLRDGEARSPEEETFYGTPRGGELDA
jgi:hypothetical protein